MEGLPKFKFEKLHIWKDAMKLGEAVVGIADNFPDKERFNLTSQICRAVDSVALNISEGSIVQSKPEFRRFLGYSARSLAEVVTCLHTANHRKYISSTSFSALYDDCFKLMNMIIAFRNKL
ncbi:four helix bundle protein [Flagellimonas sp.]|uniref:four helix bundle protein n=1 Tax=Flagellimonas sp. TaxID=2058762 RepID=UPI003F4A4378